MKSVDPKTAEISQEPVDLPRDISAGASIFHFWSTFLALPGGRWWLSVNVVRCATKTHCQCGQMCIGKYWKAIQSKIIGKFPTGIFSARILLQVW